MGISYGGISQLFTAADQPAEPRRDLAAVGARRTRRRRSTRAASSTPASRSPGPRSACTRRCRRGPNGGQPWAYKRIQEGDTTCEANQVLHAEAADLMAKIRANDHYVPAVADPLSRSRSSTRSRCRRSWPASGRTSRPAATARRSPSASPARAGSGSRSPTAPTSTRSHPETFNRWYDFLQLYVAKQAPIAELGADPRRRAGDLPGGDGDHGRDAAARPDPAAADLRGRAGRVRALPPVRDPVRQRRRRPAARPPGPRLRALVPSFPIPGTTARTWYFGARRRARRRARPRRPAPTRSPGTRTRGR